MTVKQFNIYPIASSFNGFRDSNEKQTQPSRKHKADNGASSPKSTCTEACLHDCTTSDESQKLKEKNAVYSSLNHLKDELKKAAVDKEQLKTLYILVFLYLYCFIVFN